MNFVQTEESPYKVTLEIFEGPLDLLLHLIRSHEIDIYDIPIAKVTEQYLSYLSLMESMNLEVAGEWLVMAATLIEIKSKMLLPQDPTEEVADEEKLDPRMELVERLIEYERFKSAADIFRERETQRARVYVRGPAEFEFDLKPVLSLEDITATDLLSALQQLLSDVGEETVTTVQRRKMTVRIRMREIWRRLEEKSGQLSFKDLFDDTTNRVEIVITFLALLELLKMRKVKAKQKKAFSSIEIVSILETNGT